MRHVENGRLSGGRVRFYFTGQTGAAGVGRDLHLLGRDLYGAFAVNRLPGGDDAREAEKVKADSFPFRSHVEPAGNVEARELKQRFLLTSQH
jgi:hypothetical protein